MTPHAAERRAVAAMVAATALWGGTFVAIRDSVAAIPPVVLVAVRFLTAGVLFTVLLLVRRHRPTRREWQGGALSGVLMVGGFTFQAIGLKATSAGSSAFLTSAGTLLTGFWAWLLLRQRPDARLLAGLAVAFAGSALLSLQPGFRMGAGDAWTMLGATLFGLQVVGVARFARGSDAAAIVCIQSYVAALILLPFVRQPEAALPLFQGVNLARFGYLVLAGSVLAPTLQVLAQATLSAGRVGLLFALEPVFALLWAITLGGEHFTPRWWAGAALILAAVLVVESRPET